jgi:mevalonate kinase
LEVGHAALETVRVKTAAPPYNLSTKLTGAGGGGCALTLIPDGAWLFQSTVFSELCAGYQHEKLEALKQELVEAGFECYETSVGGSGCGVMVPQHVDTEESAEGGAQAETVPLRKRFLEGSAQELEGFLSVRPWQFV